MLRELFSPFGKIERAELLRVCGALYLAQIIWAALAAVCLYAFMAEGIETPKLPLTSSYFVFWYLFLCAFSRRLNTLSYSRFWLIPIAVIFCIAFIMTATVSIEIVPVDISHFMEKNYPMIFMYAVLSNVVAFSGYCLVSIAIAYLPKRNLPPTVRTA
ncbi:MAG: hypothetical protein ABJN69_16055 [Hellea sp.]